MIKLWTYIKSLFTSDISEPVISIIKSIEADVDEDEWLVLSRCCIEHRTKGFKINIHSTEDCCLVNGWITKGEAKVLSKTIEDKYILHHDRVNEVIAKEEARARNRAIKLFCGEKNV